MKITVLGAAGFIGTNLALELLKDDSNDLTLVDREEAYFDSVKKYASKQINYSVSPLDEKTAFDPLLKDTDVVYHLVSTTMPTTSNQHISEELVANVVMSSKMLEACVRQKVKKVVFLSSGGTVYGTEDRCPLNEKMPTDPISSYGIQKITIEKLLYLYNYLYGLDYRIIRLSNPYGPFQRPNGALGAITTFIYRALKNEEIVVYGDGSVVRDFIYIDDAIRGILKITNGNSDHKLFNLGSGNGVSIQEAVNVILNTLNIKTTVKYTEKRRVDVPVNILDISRYEKEYGKTELVGLETGIIRTAEFLKKEYEL